MTLAPTPVRLVIGTDWDVGFQLTPDARPLDDVPPGGEYVTACAPQRSIVIREILVHGFQLVQISIGKQEIDAEIVSGGETRRYRFKSLLAVPAGGEIVHVGETVHLRLRNDADFPRKPKTATLIVESTRRPEDAVACPACGKEPGDSCDGPASHPSRVTAHHARSLVRVFLPPAPPKKDWVVENIKIGNVVAAPDPSIRPGGTIDFEGPALPKSCPSCHSPDPALRFGHHLAILVDGAPPPALWCQDAWHDQPRPEPERHAPRITRTLYDGPGNAMDIRGCSCGAEVGSAEAFAAHVGVSADAVRSMLDLAGIADDLLDYHAEMKRKDVARRIARCLEFPPRTVRLRAYLDVERAMMALDDANDSHADALRDALDSIWDALSDAERDFLNRRKVIK